MKKTTNVTGEQLRQVRKELGLTQKQMGDELGVHGRQIRFWENEERKFNRGTVLAYLYLLGQFENRHQRI